MIMRLRKIWAYITVLTIIAASMVTLTEQVFAENTKNSYEDIENSLNENENRLIQINEETDKINSQLEDTQKQIAMKENEINTTNNEIEQIENEIKQTELKMKQLRKNMTILINRIQKREELVKDRLRSIQQNGGNMSYLEVLFGSKSFGDLISRATVITTIVEQDRSIINEQIQDKTILEENQIKLADEQAKIESKRKKAKEKQERLVLQKQELDLLESNLNDKIDENQSKRKDLENKQLQLQKRQERLEKESLKVLSAVSKQSKPANNNFGSKSKNKAPARKFIKGNEQFIWPTVGGQITTYQGMRWGKFHKGIDIAGPSDYSILAADSGKVTFAGWINGYGKTVKMDHNNGYTTQYAHLNSINVSVGDVIDRGSKIGVMGSTGESTGIHLDFEIYLNGNLLNPIDELP